MKTETFYKDYIAKLYLQIASLEKKDKINQRNIYNDGYNQAVKEILNIMDDLIR